MRSAPRRLCTFTLLFASAGMSSACGESMSAPSVPIPTATAAAASLPLLNSDGVHLYVQEAYEGFSDAITTAVSSRYAELVDAGMDCSRHLFDWVDLQPERDVIVESVIGDAMDFREALGTTRQFVNITVIDSGGPEAIPSFVRDLLDKGVRWDDERIVAPFLELLTATVPAMVDRGMYMISFANEPSGFYEDDPKRAAEFTEFVRQAIAHTRTLNAELATTIVFAGTTDAAVPHLMPLIDVATFNHYAYGLDTEPTCSIEGTALPFFRATGPDDVAPVLDEMIEVAGGRLVCIQEYGQSTGWNDQSETLGPLAGLDTQDDIMTALIEALDDRRDHFRTVSVWTLNDHSRSGMQYVIDAITAEGLPPCYAANIAEIFGPTGLVRSDALASKKPAFETVRTAIAPLRDGSGMPGDLSTDDVVDPTGLGASN